MRIFPVRLAALAMLVTACGATTHSARFVKAAPQPADRLIKYFSTKLPSCAYDELGIVYGTPKTGFTRMQQVLDEMTAEARRMGGDAIVRLRQGSTVTESENGAITLDSVKALVGVVIRFTASDCTS